MKKEEVKSEVIKVFKSKLFRNFIYFLGFIIIASFIFKAGMYAGLEKASFGRNWGDNYSKNFGIEHRGPRMMMEDFDNFPNPNGAIGKIIKIEDYTFIVIDDKDGVEKVILINEDTEIRERRDEVSQDELIVGSFVVVIGESNETGQIEAKLIRIMPAPEDLGMRDGGFKK